MPAHPKLTAVVRAELLVRLAAGDSMLAACAAVGVSREAVRKLALADAEFAAAIDAARKAAPENWRLAALRLESQYPERWGARERR